MVPGGASYQFESKGKGRKPCAGEGRSVDIEYMHSVKASREKMKESKGVVKGKKPSYCKLKGGFIRDKRYCA